MKKFTLVPFLPTEVEVEKINDNSARVFIYPFESGYAITLAHPLRRILMMSTVGYSPIAVKIEGAKHEFDSIRGMLEDVAVFILNLKNIRFKILDENLDRIEVKYSFDGSKEITGADLVTDDVDVINKDSYLATINLDCNLTFSIIIQKAIGYVPSEDIRESLEEGYIPLDAFFSPVKKAIYKIENVLVEDNPNYEKIVFEIETDGQICPIEAFKNSITTMHEQMQVFSKVFGLSLEQEEPEEEDKHLDLDDLLVKIEDLNLSARSFNSLDRAGIKYLGELVLMSELEIKNIKNLGKKSFDEISSKLEEFNYPINQTLSDDVAIALKKKLEQLKKA